MTSFRERGSRSTDQTSNSLLDLIRSHDPEGWRCLTELYGPLIYHWCRKTGLPPEDAADIMQEVFRSLTLHVGGFEKTEPGSSFRAWLWSITRNKIRDHYRVLQVKGRAAGGTDAYQQLLDLPDREPTESADSALRDGGGLAQRALQIIRSEVKETTWLAFWRTTMDEVSPAAVAEELGLRVESVWQAKSRVLRRLRQLLE